MASSFFFLVFAYYGQSGWAVANLVVAAASMGFLVHNWPPARIFMGDAGSAFLGAFYGMQSVVAALSTPVPFPVLVLPFANFILDTTFTLFRRMIRRGEVVPGPPQSLYQRMTDLGMTHGKSLPSNCSWRSLPVLPPRPASRSVRGADRFGGFRGRRDSLHRGMGLGQGTGDEGEDRLNFILLFFR